MNKSDEKIDKVLTFINEYTTKNNYPPSVREIAAACGIKSTSNVHYYIEKLKSKGIITTNPYKSRSVSINNKANTMYAPLVGKVSAGTGILAFEDIEGELPLPSDYFGEKDLFLLRVSGQSMINVGINDGDLVVVHKQSNIAIGEIGVVFWQDKATIKTIKAVSPNLVLHPENDTMTDIEILADEFPQILGKVVGSLKRF